MARAYGDDLRRRVLGAYASGAGTLEQLAARFDVSFGWVKKIRRAELATGRWAGTPQRRRTSSLDSVPPAQGLSRPSNKLSRTSCRPSPQKTPGHGSYCDMGIYLNEK